LTPPLRLALSHRKLLHEFGHFVAAAEASDDVSLLEGVLIVSGRKAGLGRPALHLFLLHRRGRSRDAHPIPILVDPGIGEAIQPHIRFSTLDALCAEHSGRDRYSAHNINGYGFRRHTCCSSDGFEARAIDRNSLRHQATIIVHQDGSVVTKRIDGLGITKLKAWFHAFSIATIFVTVSEFAGDCAALAAASATIKKDTSRTPR